MKWIYVFVLFTHSVLSANIDKIITTKEISRIDSLLFNGNLPQINNFFSNKDAELQKLILTDFELNKYSKIKDQYIAIIKFTEKLKSSDQSTINSLIKQYNNFEERFKVSNAGEKSFELYQKYKAFCEKDEKVKGLKFYRIAYYFKTKFIQKNINLARNKLKISYQLYNDNFFDKAQRNVNILFEINRNIKLPHSVIDSLKILKSKISDSQKNIDQFQHFWKDERVVKNVLNLSIAFNLIRQNEVNNTLLEFKQGSSNTTEWVNMKYVPSKFVSNYSASIDYRVSNSIFIGLGFNYSEFTYSAENMLDLVFYDFKLQNYSSHIFLKYQTKNYIGLRPFLTFGAGYFLSHRKKSKGIILFITDDPDVPPITQYYEVPAKTYKFPQIIYEAGLDYLHDPTMRTIFGAKLSLYQNINFKSPINQFNFAYGAYISYWF